MDGFSYNCGFLRLFDGFSEGPDSRVPTFAYHHGDPELHRLRTRFDLDGIAKSGDDWSKALNLLNWVCDHMSTTTSQSPWAGLEPVGGA